MQSFYGTLPALQAPARIVQRTDDSWIDSAGAQVPSVPSQTPRRAKSQGVLRAARSCNSCSSFYGDGIWPQAKPAAPPIFRAGGRRLDATNALDRQLRACGSLQELTATVAAALHHVDLGNAAIALSCAAKLATGNEASAVQVHPLWEELLKFIAEGSSSLEPRGLSMVVYALAKLGGASQSLLDRLAARGAQRAEAFTAGDIAKMCWAFAKLGVFDSAMDFWSVIEVEAESKVHEGTYIDVSMIAWAFATAELGSKALYMEISRAALGFASELCSQSLSNTAWALAKAHVRDSELFSALSARAKDVATDFTENEVTMLCWAQAKADEVDYQLFEMLAIHTVSTNLLPRFSAQMVSYLAWAYATAHMPHFELFEALAEYVTQHSGTLSPQHVGNLAWAFATLELKFPAALEALSAICRGGRLWDYQNDELAALFWAFARLQWIDSVLLIEMMQVIEQRLAHFDGAAVANIMASIMLLPQAENSSLAETSAAILCRLVHVCSTCAQWPEPEAMAAAIRACCREQCFEKAAVLWEALASQTMQRASYRRAVEQARASMIGMIEIHGDARQAAQLWEGLASTVACLPELATACLNCSAMLLLSRGYITEAQVVLQRLADEHHFNVVSALVANECGEATAYMATRAEDSSVTEVDIPYRYLKLARLLTSVLQEAEPKDASSVLAAARNSGVDLEALAMPSSLQHVENEANLSQRGVILELGSWSCCSTVGLGILAKQGGSRVLTNEEDPLVAAVSRSLCLLADVADTVTSHIGTVEDSLQRIKAAHGSEAIGASSLRGPRAQSDLERASALGLLRPDCLVMADCLLQPGQPRLLSKLQGMLPGQLHLVDVSKLSRGEDWFAYGCICNTGEKEVSAKLPVLPECAAFVAESNKLWRRHKAALSEVVDLVDECTSNFACRFKAACALQGWLPSASLDGSELVCVQAVPRQLEESPPVIAADAGEMLLDTSMSQEELSSLSISSWLACVDRSGSLGIYTKAVEAAFSNPLQVVQTYGSASAPQNPQFYEHFCIDVDHQAKFAKWFEAFARRAECPNGEVTNGHAEVLNHSNGATATLVNGGIKEPTFQQWLAQIDPGGALAVYAGALEDAFDTVTQVELAYKQPSGLLDCQFFIDIGIRDPSHRLLFDQWFAAERRNHPEGHDDMMFDFDSLDRLLDSGTLQEPQLLEAHNSENTGRRLSRDLLQAVYTKAADVALETVSRQSSRRLSQGILQGIYSSAARDVCVDGTGPLVGRGAKQRRSAPARLLSRGILTEVYARTSSPASCTAPCSPVAKVQERRISRTILDTLYAADALSESSVAAEGIDTDVPVAASVTETHLKSEESSLYAVLHPYVNARAAPNLRAEQVGRLTKNQRVRGVEESGWLRLDAEGCTLANVPGNSAAAWVMLDGSQLGLGMLLEKVAERNLTSGNKESLFFDFDALDDLA